MQNKKVFLASISLFAILFAGVVDAAKVAVDESVETIQLRLQGAASVFFEPTDRTLEVRDLELEGIDRNPIKIEKQGRKLVVNQDIGENVNASVRYRLMVPRGKDIDIRAGLLNMSGSLDAKELRVKSGLLNANMRLSVKGDAIFSAGSGSFNATFAECGALAVRGGSVVGSIIVPRGTRIKSRPKSWQAFSIVEVDEK